jgi:TRAP-type C4-dicarboxylate transport system substrate-binding protein
MKFDEVTTQFVLTSHVIGYDLLTVSSKAWSALKPDQQSRLRAAAEKAIGDYTAKFEGQERDIVAALKAEGKKVYVPDVAAFRTFAQKRYVDKYGHDWPAGAIEKINAL